MAHTTNAKTVSEDILDRLRGLPGLVGVCAVEDRTLEELLALEGRYEGSALIPLVNQGMRSLRERKVVLALLKDCRFREPPGPTVYLVEDLAEGEEAPAEHVLHQDGRRYRVVGEEVLDPCRTYGERTVSMSGSFVLFPKRRSRPGTPSYFLVPALSFPELEEEKGRLGIDRIVSISPSAPADDRLRAACGFPVDPALATLLVGFDPAG